MDRDVLDALSDLDDGDLENLVTLAQNLDGPDAAAATAEVGRKHRDRSTTRRDLLKVGGGVGVGALLGGGATGVASAQADDTDSVPDVGTPSQPVDVFADGISANEVSADEINNIETPQKYGAVGDGSTDDTQAFLDWDANASAGDALFIPPGDYLVQSISSDSQNDHFVKITTDDVAIRGVPGASQIRTDQTPNGTNTDILKLSGERPRIHGIVLRGPGTTSNTVAALHHQSSVQDWAWSSWLEAYDCGSYGLDFSGKGDWYLSFAYAQDIVNQGIWQSSSVGGMFGNHLRVRRADRGLHLAGSSGGVISNLSYDNEDAKNSGSAVYARNDSGGYTLQGIVARNCNYGVNEFTSGSHNTYRDILADSLTYPVSTGSGTDTNFANVRTVNTTNVIGSSDVRTRWNGVIGGGPIGGVDLSTTTGQFVGDRAMSNGTNTSAYTIATWTGSAWQPSDGGATI